MRQATVTTVQPLALSRRDAAAALGISLTTFEERVQPELSLIRVGRKRLVAVTELQRWISEASEPPMAEVAR